MNSHARIAAALAAWIVSHAPALAQHGAPPPRSPGAPVAGRAWNPTPPGSEPYTCPEFRPSAAESTDAVDGRALVSDADRGARVRVAIEAERGSRVYWDEDEQGATCVRGRNYKASFGADGATYYPLFGAEQPRHFPVTFSLSSASSDGDPIPLEPSTTPIRDGNRVVYERGIVDEVWEIGLDSIEQTFVVGARPQGDLVLSVDVGTELARGENDAGFEYANEHGSVRYGRAFVREASGTKREVATRMGASGVEIELDAQYLSSASFPLVVDPVVTTFSIVPWIDVDRRESDVAYDLTTDRYLYVYIEGTLNGDGDVFSALVNSFGTVVHSAYVDITTDAWVQASAANLNAYDQFLVAGHVERPSGGGWNVRGRVATASGLGYGPRFTISLNDLLFLGEVSVGGDPYPTGPAYYCVAWDAPNGPRVRLVTSTGGLVGTGSIHLDPPGYSPSGHSGDAISVSKGNAGNRWNLAFELDGQILGAQVEWDASAATTPFLVEASGGNRSPAASTLLDNGDYAVVWEHVVHPWDVSDLHAALMHGSSVLAVVPLTARETPATLALSQTRPDVDSDGVNIAVTYMESESPLSSHGLLRAGLFRALGAEPFAIVESHLLLGPAPQGVHSACAVTSTATSGGAAGRFATVGGNFDTYGAFLSVPTGGAIVPFCPGDGTGTACPCGNSGGPGRGCANSAFPSGALLVGTGQARVTGDSLRLQVSGAPAAASCFFLQTTAQAGSGAGVVFGDGVKCTAGSQVILGFVSATSGGSAAMPVTGGSTISVLGGVPAIGATRYYQCLYTNSAPFCTSSTTNFTNGVQVTWLP